MNVLHVPRSLDTGLFLAPGAIGALGAITGAPRS